MTSDQLPRMASRVTLVAAGVVVLAGGLMLLEAWQRTDKDPLDSPSFVELKGRLVQDRQNEELKRQVRDEDQRLRERYFGQRKFADEGRWLMLIGSVLALGAAKWNTVLRRKLPTAEPHDATRDPDIRDSWIATLGLGVLGGVAVITILSLALSLPRRF